MFSIKKIFAAVLAEITVTKNVPHRHLFFSSTCCKKVFSRSPSKYSISRTQVNSDDSVVDNEIKTAETSEASEEDEYRRIVDRTFRIPDMGHQVFVIQPYIKWGPEKKRNTTPELQLAESCTLVKTLSNWCVIGQTTVSLMSLDRATVFGKGNLEKLEETIVNNGNISAVFISIDILRGSQRDFLEKLFRLPIYDRYSIVIQIFREHAVSRESKLQIKLAELPYLHRQLRYLQPSEHFRGKGGETFIEFHRNLLKEQEKKIKMEIESLRSHRNLIRKKRQKSELPVVAVVGYTNCGKTSLIKALTGEESITPKNVLFATLDVTAHSGILPSGMKCVFVDTIGFISDIPMGLLESFVSTLEDALLADVIVHVRDVSHPDNLAQSEHVYHTLQQLNLSEPLMKNIITIGNKIDLLDNLDENEWPDTILTSTVKSWGLDEVKDALEEAILCVGGRKRMEIRLRTGGEEYQWLRRQASSFTYLRPDPNNQEYSFIQVVITPEVLAKFTHLFITSHQNSSNK